MGGGGEVRRGNKAKPNSRIGLTLECGFRGDEFSMAGGEEGQQEEEEEEEEREGDTQSRPAARAWNLSVSDISGMMRLAWQQEGNPRERDRASERRRKKGKSGGVMHYIHK